VCYVEAIVSPALAVVLLLGQHVVLESLGLVCSCFLGARLES
jgi:hypothetical protein